MDRRFAEERPHDRNPLALRLCRGLQQGLRILDIRFPHDPVEIGYYDTYNYRMPHEPGGAALGAYGLDVRNADGLIVVADDYSGFWAFRMDGFDKWNGHD